MAATDPSYRFLACEYLRGQLQVLARHLLAVRRNEDTEPVHQARVASRRLRTALRVFADCLDPKQAGLWQKGIRSLTRDLGAARDRDVQIEYVESLLAGLDKQDGRHRAGVKRLLLRLRQSREALQPEVIHTLDTLEHDNLLAEMYGELEKTLFALKSHDASSHNPSVFESTCSHIRAKQRVLFDCAHVLDDAEDVSGHHRMRIAAKKLRYALEIGGHVCGERLADAIKAAKHLQSLLGEIHDCDVWVLDIDKHMEQERLATLKYFGHSLPFNRLKPGLLLVRKNRIQHRQQVFAELIEYWRGFGGECLGTALKNVLESHEETPGQPDRELQDEHAHVGQEEVEKNSLAE